MVESKQPRLSSNSQEKSYPMKTNTKKDLNDYIKKSHIKAVEKFNEELQAWAKETGEKAPTLYEDANTSFTLSDITVERGKMFFNYDGKPDSVTIVIKDNLDGEYFEEEGIDGIMDYVKFWRSCLRRAKRYWSMDPDRLDRIQEGEEEDIEEDD